MQQCYILEVLERCSQQSATFHVNVRLGGWMYSLYIYIYIYTDKWTERYLGRWKKHTQAQGPQLIVQSAGQHKKTTYNIPVIE